MSDQKVDNRLKEIEDEILLLSGHLSDAVDKKLGVRIGDLKDGMEKFRQSALAVPSKKGAPAAPSFELNKLQDDIEALLKKIGGEELDGDKDNLAQRLENFSGTIMKGIVGLETTMQNAVEQTAATQDVVKNTLAGNLKTLNDAIEKVSNTLTTDVEETLRAEIVEIKDRIGNLSEELLSKSGNVMDSLSAIEKNVKDTVDSNGAKQEAAREVLLQNLSGLNEVAETIQQMLAVGEDTTAGTEIIEIKNQIGILSVDMLNSSDTIREELTALDKGIGEIADVKSRIEELSEELTAGTGTIKEDIAALDKGVSEIADVKSRIEELSKELISGTGTIKEDIAALDKGISEITDVKSRIEELSKELISGEVTIKEDVAALDSRIKNAADNIVSKQDEVKSILQADIGKLDDNTEIIRRMVTTDEEKYLGSLVTMIHETVSKLSTDLPELAGQINNRLVNVFKNAQDNATQDMAKQEEIKKILLYDLYKLNESSEAMLRMCTTVEERPLGGEVIVMSDRVEQIAGQMPNITEKINNHSAQLDKISSEVIRMRWFVVGAVVISLAVLITSFLIK